ncbi:MAG TPA: hypothetical protein VGF17_24490 [Phytomonospora sp.]
MGRTVTGVDPRPKLARGADRVVLAALLGITGCALLGAGLAAKAVLYLTTPKEES